MIVSQRLATLVFSLQLALLPSAFAEEKLQCPDKKAPEQKVDDGVRWQFCSKKKGIPDGPSIGFDSVTGFKKFQGSYAEGVREGVWKEFYADGKVMAEYTVKAGKESGPFTKFHPNGEKRASGTLDDGDPSGQWTFWDDSGKQLAQGPYGQVKPVIDAWAKAHEGGGRAPANK